MDNEVMELIDQLYTMVSEAWGVPLGNEKCIVERDQVLEILDEIKTAMPVELSEAKRLVSARDEFINNAKREAEGIRNQAEERARALVNALPRHAATRCSPPRRPRPMHCVRPRASFAWMRCAARRRRSPPRSAACSRHTPRFRASPAARPRPQRPLQHPLRVSPRSTSRTMRRWMRKSTDCRLTAHLNRRRSIRRRFCVLPKIFPTQCAPGVPGGCFFPVWRHILCRHFLFSARNAKPCDRENNGRIARNVGNCKKWAGISPCNFSVLPL